MAAQKPGNGLRACFAGKNESKQAAVRSGRRKESHFTGGAHVTEKRQEVLQIAHELFRQSPDWVTYFREVLGLEGVIRKAFPEPADLFEFERCAEYREIQNLLAQLRDRRGVKPKEEEPTTVITVRLPKSLHDALRVEAHERKTSINRLCIAKLLQAIDEELVAERMIEANGTPVEV